MYIEKKFHLPVGVQKRFKKGIIKKEYNKVGTLGAIPYTLPPTNLIISLLPALQLDVKKTIWKDKQGKRRKY